MEQKKTSSKRASSVTNLTLHQPIWCVNMHQVWKPHVPFIMFCCGHLRQAKPSLSDAGIQQFVLHPTPRSLSPSLFPTSFNPLLDFALRSPPSLWRSAAQHSAVGVPPTPPTALAQISSLRHGLLTPSVGFRQSPARPSQGKVAAINHLPQSLSVSLGGGGGNWKVRSCDSGGDVFGSRCRVAEWLCVVLSARRVRRPPIAERGRLDVSACKKFLVGRVLIT